MHCVTQNINQVDYQILVPISNGNHAKVGINIRPYAIECLKELAQHFELIVFSSGNSNYASKVVSILDPYNTIFSFVLFRKYCIHTNNGLYLKDLRILNRDLSKVVIVDNSILSFAFQLDNGIPIVPFQSDKTDAIFPKVKDYILSLKNFKDYRLANLIKFGLRKLYDLNVQNFLPYYEKLSQPNNEETRIETNNKNSERVCLENKNTVNKDVESELMEIKKLMPIYLKTVKSRNRLITNTF